MIDLNSECWSIAFCLGFLGYRLCSDICSVLLLPQPVCLIYLSYFDSFEHGFFSFS